MSTLGPDDQRRLLAIARRALHEHLTRAPSGDEGGPIVPPWDPLAERGAAFTTLRNHGRLRGCIGRLEAREPLWKTVVDTTIGAATRDFRFESVTAAELDEISIKISVLSAPRAVASWQDIEIGRHGIVMSKEGRASTFLPEVPVENHWTLEETLDRLARKAGLPEQAWREGASFEVFEAQVFGDPDQA